MRCGLLTFALLVATLLSARACKEFSELGIAQQTVQSDTVVVGSVTFIEQELAEIKTHPSAAETTSYSMAIVKVETAIRGVKTTTVVVQKAYADWLAGPGAK